MHCRSPCPIVCRHGRRRGSVSSSIWRSERCKSHLEVARPGASRAVSAARTWWKKPWQTIASGGSDTSDASPCSSHFVHFGPSLRWMQAIHEEELRRGRAARAGRRHTRLPREAEEEGHDRQPIAGIQAAEIPIGEGHSWKEEAKEAPVNVVDSGEQSGCRNTQTITHVHD